MKELLKDYDKKKVEIFINYLPELENETDKTGKLRNWWFSKVSKEEFANAFKKVANEGLFIDGDTVTLNYRKKLVITYDYHAYQNKVNVAYPETIFDFGLVYLGDKYSFTKESGKVIYNHEISDPFNSSREIIGAYGVIKNKKGEFLETINLDDIKKMRKSSLMGYIWDNWLDRMILKSVIKRICKIHFKDEVKGLEDVDNEEYDMDLLDLEDGIETKIKEATTLDDLSKIYKEDVLKSKNKKTLLTKLTARKKEIQEDNLKVDNEAFKKELEKNSINHEDFYKCFDIPKNLKVILENKDTLLANWTLIKANNIDDVAKFLNETNIDLFTIKYEDLAKSCSDYNLLKG